ncbi:MAG: SDR family oxidoreductase [Pirellulaceae bacterium]|nr:SDR family oxidoreductase [Pirellulaceae bacterium]
MRFQNKVVVVTGGAAGIGRGCVEVFHAEQATVAIIDRDAAVAQALADQLNSLRPGSAATWVADVAQSDQLQSAIRAAAETFGRIDCLINNAGIHPPDTPLEQMSLAEAQQVMAVNFFSTYVASQAALPYLRTTRGTIINMSSMTAVLGQKNSAAYAASKGAQLSFTKALALEVAVDGIRVNAVLPSNVDTPLMRAWAGSLADPQSALDRIAQLQPLGRMAQPQEIGRVCLFLASEDASFITGQGIEADGGAALDY